MACCIIAAFLFAQFLAMLRRWGIFWGILPVPEGEHVDTAYTWLVGFIRRPVARRALVSLLVIELGAASSWLYAAHGTHIAEEADIAWSGLRGETIAYSGICTGADDDHRLRVVIASHADSSISYN